MIGRIQSLNRAASAALDRLYRLHGYTKGRFCPKVAASILAI